MIPTAETLKALEMQVLVAKLGLLPAGAKSSSKGQLADLLLPQLLNTTSSEVRMAPTECHETTAFSIHLCATDALERANRVLAALVPECARNCPEDAQGQTRPGCHKQEHLRVSVTRPSLSLASFVASLSGSTLWVVRMVQKFLVKRRLAIWDCALMTMAAVALQTHFANSGDKLSQGSMTLDVAAILRQFRQRLCVHCSQSILPIQAGFRLTLPGAIVSITAPSGMDKDPSLPPC